MSATGAGDAPLNPPMSKGALKRQAREERVREHRKQKKLAKKEEKRQELQEKGPAPDFTWEPLPHETRNPTRQEKKKLQQESLARIQSNVTIAIDCAFEKYMTEQEKKSMHQQIAYSYASNKEAPIPCKLVICGLEPFLKERLDKMKADTTWTPWGASTTTEPIEKVFPVDNMVYLSADSDVVLDSLEEGKTYIIGGIVDRNRHKGLCANKAKELGIPTAKFPLDAYFTKAGFCRVLTTNHCVDTLLEFLASRDWMQACKRGVPVRKLKTKVRRRGPRKDGEDGNADEGDEDDEDEDAPAEEAEPPAPTDQPIAKPAVKAPRHALVIGTCFDKSFRVCEELAVQGWSVLFACPTAGPALAQIQSIRAKHADLNGGELAVVPADCALDGDVVRVKEIIFRRFSRTLHAVVFVDDRLDDSALNSRTAFVRDFFRLWSGPGRQVPKFVFADVEGPQKQKMGEWLEAFKGRHSADNVKVVSDSVTLDDTLSWVNLPSEEVIGDADISDQEETADKAD